MKVKELIHYLNQADPELEILIREKLYHPPYKVCDDENIYLSDDGHPGIQITSYSFYINMGEHAK